MAGASNPTASNVSVPLSAFSSGYSNGKFIADEICPVVEHDAIEGTYFSKARVDSAREYADELGANGTSEVVEYDETENAFICKSRGLKAYVPYAVIDNAADILAPLEAKAKFVMHKLKLKQERRVAALLLATGSYASGNTAGATAPWTNTTTSAPIKDIQAAVAAIAPGGEEEDEIVMGLGLEAWQALSRHPEILGLRPGGGTQGGVVRPDEIAEFLGLNRILVSNAEYATSAKGATGAFSRIWDTTKAVIARRPKAVPQMVEGLSLLAAQIRFSGPNQFPWTAVEWDDPDRGGGRGSRVVKISHYTVEKIIQNDAGFLLTSVT